MLNAIIRFSVRNKLIIGVFTIALIIAGVINLRDLSVDALPDITSNQVQIITVSPSLAAPEVERLITFPLEQNTTSIPGVKEMRSFSRFGLSVLTIVFDDKTELYWARQQVNERLTMARELIPPEAGVPELAPATTGLGEIYQYVIRPAKGFEGKYDLADLRSVQDWIVRRQLLGTPGVAEVSSFGGFLKQYEVAVIPDRLKSMRVTIADIFNALEKNNQNSGGAYIEHGPAALFIRTEGLAETTSQIEKIVVRYIDNGLPVRIADVAEVRIGHAIRYGALTYKNEGEVSGAVVLMLKGANASKVVASVKSRIEDIRKTLPEGILLEPFYDRTKMVNNAIRTVSTNLLEGALIVIFVLVLFLGNLRAGLIVASVIPLSMLFAVILMNIFGVSGNLMSLGALDFGLIVDGAVIIVEAVLFRLHSLGKPGMISKLSREEINTEVEQSAGKMMSAAVFGQIIILIVYLPILSLTGIEGKMFRPMAQTVSFALIGAFLLSVTYIPMMSSLMISRKITSTQSLGDRLVVILQRWYIYLLNKALAFPRMVVSIALLLFAFSAFILSTLGGEFIPEMEEGDFAVDARLIPGSSLTETINTTQKAVTVLQQNFPEIEKIVTRIGASEIPTDPMPIEMTDLIISLKPKSEWTSASGSEELAGKMSAALSVIPGLSYGFQFPVQMRFNELISGAKQDIVCKIFGEDLDTLAILAKRVGAIVRNVSGAKDVYIETVTGLPQIVIRYNREAMATYQLSITDVNQVVRTAFAGESAGLIYEKEKRFDLVVRLKDEKRKNLEDVSQLLIPAKNGLQIPLYQLADVEIKEGPNQIQREDARRRIIVGFNVRGRDIESVVNELRNRVENNLKLPSGYSVKYGGQFENMTEAKERLSIAVPAALLLILLMLYFAFGTIKYGLLIFSAIPLAAIGGIFALWIRNMPFSISAGVGFIALFGVAVLNGIVMIAEFNRLKNETDLDLLSIIREGVSVRLRPVLMTASVASLGFIPMAFSHGVGAEVQRPLATVVIGGLISATLLTLFVLPVLYKWMEQKQFRTRPAPVVLLLIFCMFMFRNTSAQTSMTLNNMLRIADEQNLSIQGMQKQAEYWKQLSTTGFDPAKTQLGAEFGNINSSNTDTRFFINQSLSLPPVYKRQKQVYQSQAEAQNQLLNWKKAELHKEIQLIFFRTVNLLERKKILIRLDSAYGKFQQAAQLRYTAGESNLLEKTTAEAQLQQLRMHLMETESDIIAEQKSLQLLLNTDSLLLPLYNGIKKMTATSVDSFTHPQIQYNVSLEKAASAMTLQEKSKLLPEFSFGYSNLSIIGYQSVDGINQKYYDAGNRFHIVNLATAIPIFNKATKSRIKAGELNMESARINTRITAQKLSNQQQQLNILLQKLELNIRYFEQMGIQQSELIAGNAQISFRNGEISYLEWTILMSNAINIQANYLNSVSRYNEVLIELEYLSGKN